MERKKAQDYALMAVEKQIAKNGENGIACFAPKPGKNKWTWGEMRKAIINDERLEENEENSNPIDAILHLNEFLIRNGKKSLF